ncbi:MAG: ThuA domain-containing protein [Owenweeksia sp.]|nr:ThuA domain-containing protein [Owenweeksia sp.]
MKPGTNPWKMFRDLRGRPRLSVDDDGDGSSFNSLANLQQYDIVVFSNTSGDNILSLAQRQNFEDYIAGGGNYLGIACRQ